MLIGGGGSNNTSTPGQSDDTPPRSEDGKGNIPSPGEAGADKGYAHSLNEQRERNKTTFTGQIR